MLSSLETLNAGASKQSRLRFNEKPFYYLLCRLYDGGCGYIFEKHDVRWFVFEIPPLRRLFIPQQTVSISPMEDEERDFKASVSLKNNRLPRLCIVKPEK